MAKSKKYPITPSDWITYLQGEISSELSIMLSIVAVIVLITISLTQLSIMTGDLSFISIRGQVPNIIDLAIQWGFIVIVIFVYIALIIKPKIRLCKRIIKGELTTSKDILKEYNEKIGTKFKSPLLGKIKKSKKSK